MPADKKNVRAAPRSRSTVDLGNTSNDTLTAGQAHEGGFMGAMTKPSDRILKNIIKNPSVGIGPFAENLIIRDAGAELRRRRAKGN